MKEHPQADILRAIADGKTIEWKLPNKDWKVCENPLHFISDPCVEFRSKPEVLLTNGHEVPAPVREPLKDGQEYCAPDRDKTLARNYTWSGSDYDALWLRNGIIHLTKESAIALAEALLSFTRSNE